MTKDEAEAMRIEVAREILRRVTALVEQGNASEEECAMALQVMRECDQDDSLRDDIRLFMVAANMATGGAFMAHIEAAASGAKH